jgi:cytochrome c-type biogenesis protein CcmH
MSDFAPQSTIDIPSIKNQLQQLKDLHASGTLTDEAYGQSKEVLERRLLDWVLTHGASVGASPAVASDSQSSTPTVPASAALPHDTHDIAGSSWRKRWVPVALGALLIVGGGIYYASTGSSAAPAALLTPAFSVKAATDAVGGAQAAAPHSTQAGDMATMAARLAARLDKQPNDPQGWAMLARSYKVLGDQANTLKTYEKAVAMSPDDKALAAEYADVLDSAKKNPAETGISPVAGQATLPKPGPAAAAGQTVSGRVTLAAALAKKVEPTDTVFVVARAPQGSRMPLAVLRKQVKDLPLQFTLDDSLSMSPVGKLSTAGQVIVSARISKSGNAMLEPGDWGGQTKPVAVGTQGLSIEINAAAK